MPHPPTGTLTFLFTDIKGSTARWETQRGGDYFGPSLNRTARLMSAGHGGQVLLSLAAQQVVRDYLSTAATKAGTAPDPSTLRRDCIPPPTGHPRSRRQAVPVG